MGAPKSSTAGQPLFIVDRDWLRQGSKARKSWTGNVRNRSLYGLAIEVTDDIPQSTRSRTRTKGKRRRVDKSGKTIGIQDSSEDALQPILTLPSDDFGTTIASNTTHISVEDPCIIEITSTNDIRTGNHIQLPQPFPRSSTFDSIKGLECYLDYYLDVIGTAHHPLETKFRQQSNPARSNWFPLAFEDDLWLQNIALFSAFHHAGRRKAQVPVTADALMSSFLSQLNERISKSDLSDGTIASVSCLMLGEHIKGNAKLAKVHASGMAEMIRLRGGLGTIQRARRAKIVRADIVRSIDTLEPPMLPRLIRDSVPLGPGLSNPPNQYREKINLLYKSGISPELTSTLWTLGSVCETVEAAWMDCVTLDATSFYESVLCINHDMLSFNSRTAFDEILKISIINFTQPMFRQCAFSEQSCQLRVQKQRCFLELHDISVYDENVALWITFVGYMTSQQISSERDWFKARLLTTLDTLSIPKTQSWGKLKSRLQDFLWTESIHDYVGRQFYETIELDQAQPAPHLGDVCVSCAD